MKILLTGASGFLGSAIARHLSQLGNDVALLLRPNSQLNRLHGQEAFFDIGRCATDEDLNAFVRSVSPEVVIHTACYYSRLGETYLQLADANVRLGLLIIQALLSIKHPITFINTGTALAPNVSPYALSKHHFSQWGRMIAEQSAGQLRFVNVLLQHMYGPGDDTSKFVSHVLHACHRNDLELNLTAGEQKRDFIYIDDVVSAYSTLIYRRNELEPALDIEVGSGVALRVRELVDIIHRLTGSRTKLCFGSLPYRTNEPMHCQADLSRMSLLGWEPSHGIEAGLKQTIEQEFQ